MVELASTREIYGKTIVDLGKRNPEIVVLGGDLNKSTYTHLFGKEFPERFFDLGAAEQNIIGVAAGFASSGKIPFVSTFSVFGTGRPFDQIRISIAQPHLNVKIVCTHAGIITGEDGISAHSIEDISLMCSLPGFTVIVPADAPETKQAIEAAANTYGPFYIRLGRPAIPIIHHPSAIPFQLGKARLMQQGSDITFIACGIMVKAAMDAAASLNDQGISCRILNMATLKPVDADAITAAAKETGAIVTAEEHYIHGGLGSVVAQVCGQTQPVPLEMVALDQYTESGKPEPLLEKYGLTSAAIKQAAHRAIARKTANR